MSVLHFPRSETIMGPPLFDEHELTVRLFEIGLGMPTCPDCGDDLYEPDCHADGCPRIETCGQCYQRLPDGTFGYLTPYHPNPPDLYAAREGETFEERAVRIDAWWEEHLREHHGAAS